MEGALFPVGTAIIGAKTGVVRLLAVTAGSVVGLEPRSLPCDAGRQASMRHRTLDADSTRPFRLLFGSPHAHASKVRARRCPSALAWLPLGVLLGCRAHPAHRETSQTIAALPPVESMVDATDALPDLPTDAPLDASLDAAVTYDDCTGWGPFGGRTCLPEGRVCLWAYHHSGHVVEARCERGVWTEFGPASPLGKKVPFPTPAPVVDAPCGAPRTCQEAHCGMYRAWEERWACYRGRWVRWDERCIGE
jgi:hypothetical protein